MSYFAIKKKSDYLKPLNAYISNINLTFVPFLVHNLIFLRKLSKFTDFNSSIGKFIWSHVYLTACKLVDKHYEVWKYIHYLIILTI